MERSRVADPDPGVLVGSGFLRGQFQIRYSREGRIRYISNWNRKPVLKERSRVADPGQNWVFWSVPDPGVYTVGSRADILARVGSGSGPSQSGSATLSKKEGRERRSLARCANVNETRRRYTPYYIHIYIFFRFVALKYLTPKKFISVKFAR